MCWFVRGKPVRCGKFTYERMTGPTSIIDVRDALHLLADHIDNGTVSKAYGTKMIRQLAEATRRKPAVSIAPRKMKELTDEQRAAIRQYHRDCPDASQLEIANIFHTNPGRVSEALNEGV